ncbi:MAG: hypothetical protein NVSMB56_10240 [Pyrinomonadaceae bacterium]
MPKRRTWKILSLCGAFMLFAVCSALGYAALVKDLEEKEASRLIARLIGFEGKVKDTVRVKDIQLLGSSAVVTADVSTAFRFDKREGKWRVAEVRVGDNKWEDVDMLARAVNAEKNARARAELETIRTALEAFKRERGFYVNAENSTTLFDFLAPRYIARITRTDPWHRPYRYTGDRQTFTLSSDGTDGKKGTADDINLSSDKE